MKRLGISPLPSVMGHTRSDLDLHPGPQSTPTLISQAKHETEVQEQSVSTFLTETSKSEENINRSSDRHDRGSLTSSIERRPRTAWTISTDRPFPASSVTPLRPFASPRKSSSTWNDFTTHITVSRQSGHVGETQPSSQTHFEIKTDYSSTHIVSGEQYWRALSAPILGPSETLELSSTWNDQLSEATVHLTAQVTGTRQSDHVGGTEASSQTLFSTASDRTTTQVRSREQPWRTSSVSILRTSEPYWNPSSRRSSSHKPSSLWNDQLSDATVLRITQATITRPSSQVNTTEPFSRTSLTAAPEPSITIVSSREQYLPTTRVPVLRTSEPSRKPSSSWNDQLSKATVHTTAPVTVTRQSIYHDSIRPSTPTIFDVAPDRSTTYATSGEQLWSTHPERTTASWPSSLYQRPDAAPLGGQTSWNPVPTSWGYVRFLITDDTMKKLTC